MNSVKSSRVSGYSDEVVRMAEKQGEVEKDRRGEAKKDGRQLNVGNRRGVESALSLSLHEAATLSGCTSPDWTQHDLKQRITNSGSPHTDCPISKIRRIYFRALRQSPTIHVHAIIL